MPEKYVRLIRDFNAESKTIVVRAEGKTKEFAVRVRVHLELISKN